MANGEDGSYLLRPSKKGGQLSLSVRYVDFMLKVMLRIGFTVLCMKIIQVEIPVIEITVHTCSSL